MDHTKVPLVFNVAKPAGMSSFSVVYHFKKNLNFDFGKIGHFGTLDPFANGVLLIGIQGAQKLNDYIHNFLPKTYRARGLFGGKTTTGDLTVDVTEKKDIDPEWQKKSREEVEIFLREKFLGEYWQSPHSVSASKFNGRRLYRYAQAGTMIEKEKVKREILSLSVLNYDYPVFDFEVTVSSGTYVRSLFEEIASLMNGVGALETLERTAIGPMTLNQSLQKANWPAKGEDFSLEEHGIPLDKVLELDSIILTDAQTKRYLQGIRQRLADVHKQEHEGLICSENYYWVYHESGALLGLAQPNGEMLAAIFNLQLSISKFC